MRTARRTPAWLSPILEQLFSPPAFLQSPPPTVEANRIHPVDAAASGRTVPWRDRTSPAGTGTSAAHPVSASRNGHVRGRRLVRGRMARRRARTASPPGGTPASVHGASAAPAAPARPLALPRSWQAACARAGIPPSVLRRYAWEISEVRHLGTVIKVETDTGTFVVKETHLPPARVAFLAAAILHAQARGCLRTAAMVPARDGQPYAVADRRTFYATPFIAGAAANFASAYHVRQIAHTLAAWYEATRGFRRAGAPAPVGMEALLRRRADDLRRFADHAERKAEQDAFDELFLEWYPALRKDAEKSLSLLAEADVAAFLRSEMAAPGLCHLDVTPANFILAADGAYALDFDLAAYAPRALDAAHLIRRGLQASAWSADVAYACFVAYNEARAMSAAEYRLVEALLRFPYRAWRLASTRYTVFAEPAQVTELADAWREEPRRQAFLDAYREQIARLQRDA